MTTSLSSSFAAAAAAVPHFPELSNTLPYSSSNSISTPPSPSATSSEDGFVPDYQDVGGLIHYLRSRNDVSLYRQAIQYMRQKLREAYESPMPLPKMVQRGDGTFNLIRTAPEVRSIVLPGGGAKGIAYVGLMRELTEAFPHAQEFIGSSAGSLAATFMSFGDDPDLMQDMLANELPKLLKTQPELRSTYPSLKFQNTMSTFSRALWRVMGGKPLGEANGFVQKLDEVTSKAARDYLNQLTDIQLQDAIGAFCNKKGLPVEAQAQLLNRINELKAPADFASNREGGMVTFSDLDLLHFMDEKRFKDIQTTGFDFISKKVKYFNASETPNVPVAYAARLSMSHPLLAQGVRMDQHLAACDAIYIDGGIASNIPSEAVYNQNIARAQGDPQGPDDEELRAKTVVMKFDESHGSDTTPKGNIFKRFFASITKRFKDWFMRLVSANPTAERDSKNDKEKFGAAGPNGYVLYHSDLRTIDMNVNPKRQERAIDEASIGVLAQALQRKGQGYFVQVGSPEEAVNRLSEAEKQQIRRAGPPTREAFGCDEAEQEQTARRNELDLLNNDPQATEEQRQIASRELAKAEKALIRQLDAFNHATVLYNVVTAEDNSVSESKEYQSPDAPTLSAKIFPEMVDSAFYRPIDEELNPNIFSRYNAATA